MLNKHSSQEYENITTDFEYEWYLFLVFKIITRIVNNDPMSLYWPDLTPWANTDFVGHYYRPGTHNKAIIKTHFSEYFY
jgi:hypothetical protein